MATMTQELALKKRSDAYTGFLAISFFAMVGACVLLYLELGNYEGKTPPKGPTIDVPGAQLKAVPGSGAAPKVAPKVEPDENAPKEMGMMKPANPADAIPIILPPLETVDVVQSIALPADPVIKIPDPSLPDPPATVLIPVSLIEPMSVPVKRPELKPIIPSVEPNLSDAPPIPPKRFVPPM